MITTRLFSLRSIDFTRSVYPNPPIPGDFLISVSVNESIFFNNRELESFTGKLKNKYGNRVRSEAEIHRLCNSYEQLQDLEVKKFTSNDDYVDIELRFYNDGSIENETMVKFFIEILNLEFWETRFNIKY